ncbi:hypothetical protein EJ065_4236 [Corallococcus coralloides]|uniref:Uncharacterized protein n=1 Tax=Corallococcus coralloides TaxID=184914 RepID=A0A410RVE5_CORCK|nr:hypothetical protein EJ065_4236 [Corallococcus coralloides]
MLRTNKHNTNPSLPNGWHIFNNNTREEIRISKTIEAIKNNDEIFP